jgi:hypothetical protein
VATATEAGDRTGPRWFGRGVASIGGASFLADLGHEVPTSLLPTLLTSALHAPPLLPIGLTAAGVIRRRGGVKGRFACTLTRYFPLCPLHRGQIGPRYRTGGVSQSRGSLVGILCTFPDWLG